MRLLEFFRRRRPEPARVSLTRRLRELEIVTARLLRAGFAGRYHAAFHGRGIEFAQVREYQPGDDVRTIDWNVTARSGSPYVKQFVEERDLTVVLALDLSGSMSFGSIDRRKIDVAIEIAAVLTFAALQNQDRVGLLLFSDDIRRFIPPGRGRVHSEMVVRDALVALEGLGGIARFEAVSDFIERVMKKRTVIIVLSDFIDASPERAIQRLRRRHDIVAIGIEDPRERRLPTGGLVRLIDSESGTRRTLDLNTHRVDVSSGDDSNENLFRKLEIDFLRVSTAIPYEQQLIRFFGNRSERRVHHAPASSFVPAVAGDRG